MPRTEDMFADLKPPRQKPRKLMHVFDAGNEVGCGSAGSSRHVVRFKCYRCGHETDWMLVETVSEAKRGIPCPQCNDVKEEPPIASGKDRTTGGWIGQP